MSRRLDRLALVAAVAMLAGCASRAPTPPAAEPERPSPTVAAPAALSGFERQQAERGEAAEAAGRWGEAALAWEVLSLLRPDDAAVRERLARAQAQRAQAVDERRSRAQAAQRRGDGNAAEQAWLELLALKPDDAAAAGALRQIERERNRRSQVGRFARPPQIVARRSADSAGPPPPAATDTSRTANSQREHATMLARQGDLDGAIALLRDGGLWRTQAAHRTLLADLYVRKAEGLRATQPEAARAAVEAALAVDARHAGALALQAQLPRPAGRGPARATSP